MTVVVLWCSSAALANPRTSLFFQIPSEVRSTLVFLAANGLIGLLEGMVLAAIFKTSLAASIVVMILANLASGFGGHVLAIVMPDWAAWLFEPAPGGTAYAGLSATVLSVALAALLEWPFCLWQLRFHDHPARRASIATVTLQIVSHGVVLIGTALG